MNVTLWSGDGGVCLLNTVPVDLSDGVGDVQHSNVFMCEEAGAVYTHVSVCTGVENWPLTIHTRRRVQKTHTDLFANIFNHHLELSGVFTLSVKHVPPERRRKNAIV